MSALFSFLNDLQRLGFGRPDADINGGDTVDVVNAHFDALQRMDGYHDELMVSHGELIGDLSNMLEDCAHLERDDPDGHDFTSARASLAAAQDLAARAAPDPECAPALCDQFGGYWDGAHPDYPVEDWQHDINDGDTRLGYWEWVQAKIDSDDTDDSQEARHA